MSLWSVWLGKNQISDSVKSAMAQEWGPLLYVGGIFWNLDSRFAVISIMQTITFVAIIVFNSIIWLMSAFKTDSMVWLAQYLNFVSLGLIGLGVLYGTHSNRGCIIRLLDILSKEFYSYGDTFDISEVVEWKKSHRKFKIMLLIGIPLYLSLVAAVILLRRWIDLFIGSEATTDEFIGEIYQNVPIPAYYPLYVSDWFLRIFATTMQICNSSILAISLGTADIMMIFLGQNVALQMRILCTAAVKLDQRSNNMYKKIMGGQAPPKNSFDRRRDRVLDECYRRAIKQIVEHHLVIQEYFDNYNVLAKWPSFLAVMNGGIIIAMAASVLILGKDTGDVPSTFLIGALLLIAEFLAIWLVCETGEQVAIWSEQLTEAMYEFNWLDISTSNKKMLLIFKEKAKNPLVLMAGGLTAVNRDTFATIMNSAYSYVNLLRASA